MFEVTWLEEAIQQLAAIWNTADTAVRQQVTKASLNLDKRLAVNPRDEGESREDESRITFEPPLAIRFRVEPDGHTVSVFHVRKMRPHKH